MRKILQILLALLTAAGLALAAAPQAHALTYYEMTLRTTSWCLTSWAGGLGSPTPAEAGAPVFLYPCVANVNQFWGDTTYGGGYHTFRYYLLDDRNGAPLCLADPGDSATDGVAFEIWYCENIDAENFAGTHYTAGAIWQERGHGVTFADEGNRLEKYNPVDVWHFVNNAPYEEWRPF